MQVRICCCIGRRPTRLQRTSLSGVRQELMYHMLGTYRRPQHRTTYGYNNVLFIVAEKIIQAVTGKTWEENMQERIFIPLGMHNTTMNEDGFLATCEGNTPHDTYVKDRVITTLPLEGEERALHWLTVISAAGGINSTVMDMMQWCRFHLRTAWWTEIHCSLPPRWLICTADKRLHPIQTPKPIPIHRWFVEQNSQYRSGSTPEPPGDYGHLCFCSQTESGYYVAQQQQSSRRAAVRHYAPYH